MWNIDGFIFIVCDGVIDGSRKFEAFMAWRPDDGVCAVASFMATSTCCPDAGIESITGQARLSALYIIFLIDVDS